MSCEPVRLVDVREIAAEAEEVVASFERDHADLLEGVEVHHIGATALPFGHTKGDVDVNLRVEAERFDSLVTALRQEFTVAQPENWSGTFASFAVGLYELPLGIQVTAIGSSDDFFLGLRDQLRADLALLERYDATKRSAAGQGAAAYWQAKDRLLRELLVGDSA